MNIGDYPGYPRYLCSTPALTVVCVARDAAELERARAEIPEHGEPGAFWADEQEAVAYALSFYASLGLDEDATGVRIDELRRQLHAAPTVAEFVAARR